MWFCRWRKFLQESWKCRLVFFYVVSHHLLPKTMIWGQVNESKKIFMSSCWVCATTAIMVKRFLSALRMTSFPDFETADFFPFISKDLSFICGRVPKKCVSWYLSKRILTNSPCASLPVFWALQRSLISSSESDAPVEIPNRSYGSRENGLCQTSLSIYARDLTSPPSLFDLEGLK